MEFNFLFFINIIKKEIVPTELICYPIVTSATILEITSAFRIVDYYYQFYWPYIFSLYAPICIATLILTYYFYNNKTIIVSVFSIVILIVLGKMAAIELNGFSSPPEIFFINYFKVILCLGASWLIVACLNEYLKKKSDEYKKKEALKDNVNTVDKCA